VTHESEIRYRTIVADPPWAYDEGYAKREGYGAKSWQDPAHYGGTSQRVLPYTSMTLADIQALPVSQFGSPARLFLWTTNRYLREAFDVLDAWGFRYAQTLVWNKTNASPFSGSVAHGSAEFILVATNGPVEVLRKMPSSVLAFGHQHAHSRKPEMFLDWIEQVSPGPYLELFARRQRLGWDTWGDDALNHVEMSA
jgi:N6-adenosine-specific RNA methylase IME4